MKNINKKIVNIDIMYPIMLVMMVVGVLSNIIAATNVFGNAGYPIISIVAKIIIAISEIAIIVIAIWYKDKASNIIIPLGIIGIANLVIAIYSYCVNAISYGVYFTVSALAILYVIGSIINADKYKDLGFLAIIALLLMWLFLFITLALQQTNGGFYIWNIIFYAFPIFEFGSMVMLMNLQLISTKNK